MTRLAILAIVCAGLVSAAWIAYRIRYNANRPKSTGGRHRVPRNHTPLSAAVRQSIAPTAYADVALHAGPDEMTGRLRAPERAS